jgi:hypothetical protein
MNDLLERNAPLSEILDGLYDLSNNYLEQIQSMCECILDERGYEDEEDEA